MRRVFVVALVCIGCIHCSIAVKGKEKRVHKDIWAENGSNDMSRRRRRRVLPESDLEPGTGGWVVFQTHNNGNGKGKGSTTNDSEDVGFPFPTIAPMDETASGGSTPTNRPTTAPPSETPPTKAPPTPQPTALSTSTEEEKAACQAAADSEVFMTETSITVRYLYELLYPAKRDRKEVASHVDESVQDLLVHELVDCTNQLESVGGVGPGEVDTVVDNTCSNLVAADASQACNLMEGSIVLFLLTNGKIISDQEGFDLVSETLETAFNGQRRRSLGVSTFVNETLGILGLHYIGSHVQEEDDSTKTEGIQVENVASGSRDTLPSSPVVPAVVVPVVLVACIASVVVALLVVRRRRTPYDSSNGLLLGDDENSLGEAGWKDTVFKSPDPLQFKVLDTTDESESGSSGAAQQAHEVVMADLTGMTVAESFTDASFVEPVFIDPDAVTLYTTSPRSRSSPARSRSSPAISPSSPGGSRRYTYQERDYVVNDTIDI